MPTWAILRPRSSTSTRRPGPPRPAGIPYPQAIAQTLAGLVHLRRGQLEEALPLLAAERGRLPREGHRRLAPHSRPRCSASRASGSARLTRASRSSRRAYNGQKRSASGPTSPSGPPSSPKASWPRGISSAPDRRRNVRWSWPSLHKERAITRGASSCSATSWPRRVPPIPAAAEDSYRQALALARELAMRPLTAQILLDLGRLYQRTGRRPRRRTASPTPSCCCTTWTCGPGCRAPLDALQALGRLFIVARSKHALYEDLRRELGGRPVTIILDRREGERRRRTQPDDAGATRA